MLENGYQNYVKMFFKIVCFVCMCVTHHWAPWISILELLSPPGQDYSLIRSWYSLLFLLHHNCVLVRAFYCFPVLWCHCPLLLNEISYSSPTVNSFWGWELDRAEAQDSLCTTVRCLCDHPQQQKERLDELGKHKLCTESLNIFRGPWTGDLKWYAQVNVWNVTVLNF